MGVINVNDNDYLYYFLLLLLSTSIVGSLQTVRNSQGWTMVGEKLDWVPTHRGSPPLMKLAGFWVFFFSEWGYRNYDLNLSFGKNQMMFPPTGGVRRLWSWRNFVFYNLIFEFFQCNIISWDNRNANLNLWLVKKNQKM